MRSKIYLFKKCLKEVENISPKLLIFTIFYGATSAILPFLNILIAGFLVNTMIDGTGKEMELILILVTSNFLLHIVTTELSKVHRLKMKYFRSNYNNRMEQKLLTVDFPDIEGQKIKNLQQYLRDMMIFTERGIYNLPSLMDKISKEFFSIIFSIGIFFTAFSNFLLKVDSMESFIASPYFTIILLLYAVVSIYLTMKNKSKTRDKVGALVSDFIEVNRIFNAYSFALFSTEKGQEIRIYNQSEIILREGFKKPFEKSIVFSDNVVKTMSTSYFVEIVASTSLHILVYIFVIVKASLGLFALGNIIQYIGVISQFLTAVTKIATSLTDCFLSQEAYEKYFELMEYPSSMYQGSLPIEKRIFCEGGDNDYEIEFVNVSFKYPNTDNYILENINFKFKVGSKLAVVGLNGSGKTTFIKLLTRFYDTTNGEILLNGINIKKYDYYEYMNVFSVVFQDYKLFPFTVGENIASCVDYDKDKVIDSLRLAGLEERIATLPLGIDTIIGMEADETGINFSGGEKQKIALARAICKNSPFIVLDEPTAALDPVTEFEIYSNFNTLVGDKTTVYISHRLSSCRFCEDIVVFSEGSIIERGNHSDLLDLQGLYHKMWYAQAKYYEV